MGNISTKRQVVFWSSTTRLEFLKVCENLITSLIFVSGKILNVREATHKQILENAEINSLIRILGLQYKKKYETKEDMKTLRYGKLMIMTDQDQVNEIFFNSFTNITVLKFY